MTREKLIALAERVVALCADDAQHESSVGGTDGDIECAGKDLADAVLLFMRTPTDDAVDVCACGLPRGTHARTPQCGVPYSIREARMLLEQESRRDPRLAMDPYHRDLMQFLVDELTRVSK